MMRIVLSLFLIILCFSCVKAQDRVRIGYAGIQQERLKSGSKLKKLLKHNNVELDTLIKHINTRIIQCLDTNNRVIDITGTTLGNQFNDMDYNSSVTSSFKYNSGTSKKYGNVISKNEHAVSNRYLSVLLSPEIKDSLLQFMAGEQMDYLLLVTRFSFYKNHLFGEETDCILHFELFDKNMIKIYGDKSEKRLKLSSHIYYSTLLFYLDGIFNDVKFKIKNGIEKAK